MRYHLLELSDFEKLNKETERNLLKALRRLEAGVVHPNFLDRSVIDIAKVRQPPVTASFEGGRICMTGFVNRNEDRRGVFDVLLPRALSPVTQRDAMAKLFSAYDIETGEEQSGSTLTACLSNNGLVTIGWVGDSTAMLVMKERASGKYVVMPLNWLHNPSDPDELSRIGARHLDQQGRRFKHGRGLSVSRTLGSLNPSSVATSTCVRLMQYRVTCSAVSSFCFFCRPLQSLRTCASVILFMASPFH